MTAYEAVDQRLGDVVWIGDGGDLWGAPWALYEGDMPFSLTAIIQAAGNLDQDGSHVIDDRLDATMRHPAAPFGFLGGCETIHDPIGAFADKTVDSDLGYLAVEGDRV